MWCVIKGSLSEHICQKPALLWTVGCDTVSCIPAISRLTTSRFLFFFYSKLSIDTATWIYLPYTKNNLVEVSVKTEHKGA